MNIFLIDKIGSFTGNIAEAWRKAGHTVIEGNSAILPDEKKHGKLDFIFCEWAGEEAWQLARTKRDGIPLIVRLHRYELFTAPYFPTLINWENVNGVVFDNDYFRRYALQHCKIICPTFVIPNGLDLEKWTFKERENVKSPDIGFVGDIGWRKGIQMLCEVIARWPWARFHLTARQISNGECLMLMDDFCIRHKCAGRVKLYPDVKDMDIFLDGVDYLISTSFSESQGMAIAEAMAKGIKPFIYHFPGAETMYPRDLLWSTLSELNERRNEPYESSRYRRLIADWGWTLEKQMEEMNKLLAIKRAGAWAV